MIIEYDLVVIGSSWEGIYAAKSAAKLHARVALVTQSDSKYLPNDTLFNYSLGKMVNQDCQLLNDSSILSQNNIINWIKNTKIAVQEFNSLASLAALGVDVIVGKGEFDASPHVGLQVEHRTLRSRRFLLATGCNFGTDFGDNNTNKNYLTLRDLADKELEYLPPQIIVVGSDNQALEIAQVLNNLGKKITLIVRDCRILPEEDRDISILIQGQLEAEGIDIYTNSIVSQIKVLGGQKWLQAGNLALSTDEIIMADFRQPNIANLNLSKVGVKYDRRRVYVNQKLATTNPSIYACGDLIGGYSLVNIARYEVNIALKNTLFFARYKTNYHYLPWAIFMQPNLARVGLTERRAKQQYKNRKIHVIKQYFNNTMFGKISDSNPGLCKLLVDSSGNILGCSLFGDRAAELITIPALMMQHKIKLYSNPMRGLTSISIPTVCPSRMEIFARAADDFYQQKIQDNPNLVSRLKTWFSLRKK